MVETYNRLKEVHMTNDKVFIVSVLIGVVSLIGTIGFNEYSKLKSMERNIESAIVKGIDPIAVKCAYTSDSTMCSLYATKAK
jgi:uncharacterized membrane protein